MNRFKQRTKVHKSCPAILYFWGQNGACHQNAAWWASCVLPSMRPVFQGSHNAVHDTKMQCNACCCVVVSCDDHHYLCSPNPRLSPNLGDPPLNTALFTWARLPAPFAVKLLSKPRRRAMSLWSAGQLAREICMSILTIALTKVRNASEEVQACNFWLSTSGQKHIASCRQNHSVFSRRGIKVAQACSPLMTPT